MSTFSLEALAGARFSRRTAVTGAVALGITGTLAGRGFDARAHQGTEYPEVVIATREFAFDMPATIESGWTRVTMDNQGAMGHHAMLMRVNNDATLEDLEAALLEPSFEPMFAVSTTLGGPSAAPGSRSSVVLDLPAGQYIAICAIPDEQGVPHYALGMQATFEVTESAATSEAPATAATVELMEMMFHGLEAATFAAGPQTWEVVNAGAVLHELVLLRLAPGVTADQFQAMMTAPPEASPMPDMDHDSAATPVEEPFTEAGGVAPINPGYTNYVELDLQPGEYAAICFVPDFESGAPHFVLGMLMGFTVS